MVKKFLALILALSLFAAPALCELTVERTEGERLFPDEKAWVYHFTYAYPHIVGEDYTCALINEVKDFGISVCAVQPGDIRTDFTASRKKIETGDDVYGGRIVRSVAKMEKDEQSGLDPQKAGDFIAKAALKERVKPLYTIDFISGAECFLDRILPKSLAYRIVGKMYSG